MYVCVCIYIYIYIYLYKQPASCIALRFSTRDLMQESLRAVVVCPYLMQLWLTCAPPRALAARLVFPSPAGPRRGPKQTNK